MNHRFTAHLTALAAAALLFFGASQALAGGTPSNTPISNSATLDYKVGTIDQTQVDSTTATFLVDKKVNLMVTQQDNALVEVTPGATNQVLTFLVANTGNDTQDISLLAIAKATGSNNPFGAGTDNFDDDESNISIFVETNGTAGYQAGADTDTYIDELAADGSKTVYIVRNMELTRANGDIAVYALVGEVRAGGGASALGAALTATTAGNETNGAVDILFADLQGTDDAATPDAKHSDRSGFKVVTATMAATKTVDAITDGAGGSFAIPGAIVTYKIVIGNAGSATASGITIIDEIPDNTSFYVTSGPTGGSAYAYTTDDTVDGNSTWTYSPTADGNGVDTTVTGIKITTADIAASGSATVTFKVKID